jgi:hypothetical protein
MKQYKALKRNVLDITLAQGSRSSEAAANSITQRLVHSDHFCATHRTKRKVNHFDDGDSFIVRQGVSSGAICSTLIPGKYFNASGA